MNRWAVFILSVLLLTSVCGARKAPDNSKIGPVRDLQGDENQDKYIVMDVSDIWTATTNFGIYGDPNAALPTGQWPGGSDNDYIWEGRFWVGATVQGKKRVTHADYSVGYEFHSSEDDPFSLQPGKSIQDFYCAYDDFYTAGTHEPLGIKVWQRMLSWSMPDYNDFIIIEQEVQNTGMVGQLPNFYAAWIFDNDVASLDATEDHIDDNVDYDGWDGEDTDTDLADWVDPLDVDDDGATGYDDWGLPYGWSNPDNPNYDPNLAEPDGIYDEYQIYLDDNGPYIILQAGDGAGVDTLKKTDSATGVTTYYKGWLVSRNMSIIYDGDNNAVQGNDTGERSLNTPCDGWTGGRLIYTPMPAYNTTLEDTMIRPFAHQWWNWNSDPGNDDEMYEYMSATHGASMGYHFIPNPREIGAPTFDYRWLTSSGPFNFPPNTSLKFIYAFCIGQGLEGVRAAADQAMVAYYSGAQWSNPANPSDYDSDLHYVLPVPPPIPFLNYSGMDNGIRLAWDNHSEFYVDPLLGYADFEGYKVYRAPYTPSGWELIYACDNLSDSLVYVVDTEGDTLNPRNMMDSVYVDATDSWEHPFVKLDLPDVGHSFADFGGSVFAEATPDPSVPADGFSLVEYTAPINYVPYYYVVVAYDSYKSPTATTPEFKPQESARANYLKDPASGAPMPVYPQNFAGDEEEGKTIQNLSKVKVVPNPYRGTNLFEAKYDETIRFINLPPACKITILTIAGDIVQTLDHDDGTDSEAWDLLSKNTQAVVSGLYLYVVESESEKVIGKFVIAR